MVQVATVLTHFLKNIFICVQENKEIHKWFGTTWGWIHDRIF